MTRYAPRKESRWDWVEIAKVRQHRLADQTALRDLEPGKISRRRRQRKSFEYIPRVLQRRRRLVEMLLDEVTEIDWMEEPARRLSLEWAVKSLLDTEPRLRDEFASRAEGVGIS